MPPPSTVPSFRTALNADIPSIVEVINRAYRVEAAFVVGDRTSPDAVATMLAEPNSAFLVAESAGSPPANLTGAVFVQVRGDRGYFGPLAVDPAHQGKGLGRRLVGAAEDYCRSRGCRYLDLDVLDVRAELLVLYRLLGFEATGTAAYPKPERLRQAARLILMTKAL
jgi:ribosomal protein S18 acetylase RimI-like enzyme